MCFISKKKYAESNKMIDKKKLVCIILNYNDAKTTLKLIKKICNYQSFSQIIVIDNCSTDNSLEYLSGRLDQFEHISIINTLNNGGYGSGNTFGVNIAKKKFGAEYALIANPDVEFSEALVENLYNYISHKEKCAVVSAVQQPGDSHQNLVAAWNIPTKWQTILKGELLLGGLLDYYNRKKGETKQGEWHEADCVAGSFLMIDIKKFLSVNGYDEDFFLYMEESVLGRKLKAAGFTTEIYMGEDYIHYHSVSISKSLSILHQRKTLLKSVSLYLKKYCAANYLEIFISHLFFSVGTIELMILKAFRRFMEG